MQTKQEDWNYLSHSIQLSDFHQENWQEQGWETQEKLRNGSQSLKCVSFSY
jgi:hypothetical protein